MARHHQFNYARPPRLGQYSPTAASAVLAFSLTAAVIAEALDPNQRTGDGLDVYGLWFAAAAAWSLPIVFGLAILPRIRAYLDKEPAIAVDAEGITIRGFTGKPLDLQWSEVTDLELEQRSDKSAALIRAGIISGAVPLDDLHVHPMRVWDVVKRCREGWSA